jgi:hypothetical protein
VIRWLRLSSLALLTGALLAIGIGVGLFVVENASWVRVQVPPLLAGMLGSQPFEVWLPALMGSWLVASLAAVSLVAGSAYYVWRRRQYEALIRRIEGELTELRNLPFTNPAPLEDLPERPDPAARAAAAEADDDGAGAGDEDAGEPPERQ